jgi:hypothetical protein
MNYGILDPSKIESKKLRWQVLWRVLFGILLAIMSIGVVFLVFINGIYQLIMAKRDIWGGKIGNLVNWYTDSLKVVYYG